MPAASRVKAHDYIRAVTQFATTRSPEIVSILSFGSVTKEKFSQSSSDVDLLIALADDVPSETKRMIGEAMSELELKHALRERPRSKREVVYEAFDRAAGQFTSHFVCYKKDLISGNTAAVFQVAPLAERVLVSTRIAFANIVTSARVTWGEDFLAEVNIPMLSKRDLAKNCAFYLLLNTCALLSYPVLPNATKYSMSVLKWMLHGCYFCHRLKSATVEEEIDFFETKIEVNRVFAELLSLRREYRPSFRFIRGCFRVIVHLYVLTVRESKFPIIVKA